MSRRAVVIGHPVTHSLSPAIHSASFADLGIDWTYGAEDCTVDGLGTVIERVRSGDLSGLSVTMPLKEEIIPYLDVLDPDAAALRAVNCVSVGQDGLRGHNTDGDGCCDAIESVTSVPVNGREVVLLGAGGTARSVALAMVRRGASVHVINRTESRTDELVDMVVAARGGSSRIAAGTLGDIAGAGILVNTTSVGMNSTESPVDASLLHAGLTVLDAVYSPMRTRLLSDAASAGATTVDGLWMLIHQARHQQNHWFGRMADAALMRAESERELARRGK